MKQIQLSHGGGGEESSQLVSQLFYRYFGNEILLSSEDAAVLHPQGAIAFTTDSFTVSPIFFGGGNIGKLSIVGTVNDLAMMGAKPLYLSCGFIIEEGFEYEKLETIVASMAEELHKCGASIVCGDTKVVPKGSVDQIFINTSGIGEILYKGLSASSIVEGDAIIVSGDIGRHGVAILMEREGLGGELQSDCGLLWGAIESLIAAGIPFHASRDATRGGLSAVLGEWATQSQICLEIDEQAIPIAPQVRGVCELFGFEPHDLANEGTFILALPSPYAPKAIEILRGIEATQNATIIGHATHHKDGKVILRSPYGSSRYLDLPKGELLPRIC